MVSFDFSGFMSEFSLNRKFAAKIFAVTERTISRWRQSAHIPPTSRELARSIEEGGPLWTRSLGRGYYNGMLSLRPNIRHHLFGSHPPSEALRLDAAKKRGSAAALRRRITENAAAQAASKAADYKARGAKATATRAAKRLALSAASA